MIHRSSGFQKQLLNPSPLPTGERGGVRGNYLEFLNKYAVNLFAMVRNEPEHLLNEFLRHNTR
jgi:hypothetical protein